MKLHTTFTRLNRSISTRSRRIAAIWLVFCLAGSQALFAESEQTARLRDILESYPDGTAGVYVKAVDGAVIVNIRKGVVFEPASTLKALHLVHTMRAVEDGELDLSDTIPWCSDSYNLTTPAEGCPMAPCGENIVVENALEKMMVNSDNRATDAIASYFGLPALNDTAEELGMDDTAVNHLIGCGGPTPNTLTLKDIGSLYEEVAMGYLDDDHRYTMFHLMLSPGHLKNTIDEEAADLGVEELTLKYFKANVGYFYKGGSYDMYGVFGPKYHRTFGGYASFPTADGGMNEYVFGAFVNNANTPDSAERIHGLPREMLREQIRAALMTFVQAANEPQWLFVWDEQLMLSVRTSPWIDLLRSTDPAKPDPDDQDRRQTSSRPALPNPDGQESKSTTRTRKAGQEPVLFVRADANLDGNVNAGDVVFLLDYLFGDGERPSCLDAADVNDDGEVDLADPTLLLGHLVAGASLPDGTTPGEYQADPTPDRIGCASYPKP